MLRRAERHSAEMARAEHIPSEVLAQLIGRTYLPLNSCNTYFFVIIGALFSENCVGLGVFHGAGFVWRDVKLENVLLRSDGHLMIADFDLAQPDPDLITENEDRGGAEEQVGWARHGHEKQRA